MHMNNASSQDMKIQDFKILSLGRELVDILKQYIELDKQFLPGRFYQIMRFIKPIDFQKLEQECGLLVEEIAKTRMSINQVKPTVGNTAVTEYASRLIPYADSLFETISSLQIIFRKLFQKGLSWSHFWEYSWREYTIDCELYTNSIGRYSILGDDINLFRDDFMDKEETIRIASSENTTIFLNSCLLDSHIQNYQIQMDDIRNIFYSLLFCGVTEQKTRQILRTPSFFDEYNELKRKNVSDYLIAGHFMCNK
jgi:hypothetical protein